ncbi:MAG TPA: hypothetical protein VIH42_13205 [Thermoguttaceae bacterium]
MSTLMKIWMAKGDGPMSVLGSARQYKLTAEGVTAEESSQQCDGNVAVLIPASINTAGIAVLLVPDELSGRLACGGQPLAAGAHVLFHADQLVWNQLRLWFAREETATETIFDPEIHGADAFCARTRSRLTPGEPIVICPGTVSSTCGFLYKAAAWMNMRCNYCGFDPRKQSWMPPRKKQGELDELLRLAQL